jgi:hypothetical protein
MITFDDICLAGRNIRVHGNGFIQIDMGPKTRVHVFGHPAIPRQRHATMIHDHRFGFHSLVVAGCLINVDWRFHNTGRPHTHAVCIVRENQGEDTHLEMSDRTGWIEPVCLRAVSARESYTVAAGRFHESFANEPTVTFMTKVDCVIDHQPRVLCRIDGPGADNSFNRYEVLSEAQMWDIVRESFGA